MNKQKGLADYGNLGGGITDIQLMQLKLDLYNGDHDNAIKLLEAMRYHIEEGATFNPHVYWFDAHLQRGIALMENNRHKAAEASFLRAMEFPANLEAERNSKIGIAYYYLGLNSKTARIFFTKAIEVDPLAIDPKRMLDSLQ